MSKIALCLKNAYMYKYSVKILSIYDYFLNLNILCLDIMLHFMVIKKILFYIDESIVIYLETTLIGNYNWSSFILNDNLITFENSCITFLYVVLKYWTIVRFKSVCEMSAYVLR